MAKRTAATLEGVAGIKRELTAMRAKERDPKVRLVVGYEAPYAVFVHERLDVHHPTGQAKFLEQPARTLAPYIGRKVSEALKAGKTLKWALLEGGLILLEESQKLVPVLTGKLKASGYAKVEKTG